ncbi:MAG: hypothetical protein QOF65_2931 [Thermoleophilaceae bacterium]|nr:hypothetical protein [Thermoleophilaceae bacterium]
MSAHPPLRRRVVASAIAGALSLSPALLSGFGPISVSASAAAPIVHKYSLGSKVNLTTYEYSTGPQQIRVISITQGSASLDIEKASAAFGLEVKPSAIASKGYYNGTTYGPGIAATNGDFARRLMPFHLEEIDGEVTTTGEQASPAFALNADGSHAYIGNAGFSFTGAYGVAPRFDINGMNAGNPAPAEIQAYSPVGGTVVKPPGKASPTSSDPAYCAVRLVPTTTASGGPHWSNTSKVGIERKYTVVSAATSPCLKTPMAFGTDPNAVVLASKDDGGAGATTLKALATCACPISLTWKHNGWPGVVNVIGGTPLLVDNSVNVGPGFTTGDPSIFDYQPRTAVAFNSYCSDTDPLTLCKIFLVTVDGRQTGWAQGWRMNQLGDFLVTKLKAQYALNLDGGGGTVSWAHKDPATFTPPCIKAAGAGCLIDKPSDLHGERAAIMAMVAIPGADLGVPPSLR